MTTELAELLDKWRLQCRRANVAHLRTTDGLTWRNHALGVLTAVASTIVGSTVYAALEGNTAGGVQFGVASLSVIAASLAAVQNILRYGTRAEKHRRASRDYGNVMRWISEVQAAHAPADDVSQAVERIRQRLDAIDRDAPNIPTDIWVWAVRAVEVEREDPSQDASTIDRHHWPRSWWDALWRGRRRGRGKSQSPGK